MNYVEAGLTPIGFLSTNLIFFLIIFLLAVETDFTDLLQSLRSRRIFWWSLAIVHIVFPAIVILAGIFILLPLAQGTGLIIVAAMPTLSLAALLAWLARGSVALALAVIPLITFISAATTPLTIKLWAQLHPLASSNAALLEYTPAYTLAVTFLVTVLPLVTGLLAGRWLPVIRRYTPALLWLSITICLLIPMGVVFSNAERLLDSAPNIGLTVTILYLGSLVFVYRLGDALRLAHATRITLAFAATTHNMAIAGMFAVSGLGAEGDQILTALWWVVAQYFLGFAAAFYFRRKTLRT